jgi:rhodanese-related sulfurtransferase/DNA-binding transcriptional ArsR family regulator
VDDLPEGFDPAAARHSLNDQFARVAKAVAHPGRIQLLDLLSQGEHPVDALVDASGMGRSTTSAHLQVLRRAGLVDTRREGTQIFYRVAGREVADLLTALRHVAATQLAEVDQITRDYFDARDGLEPMGRQELLERADSGEIVVVDVRPAAEYREGHIPGAVSIPLDELSERIDDLPEEAEVVAYCRGSYCVLSADAVAVLRRHGRQARRLTDGLPEWEREGHPVAVD